MDGEIIANFELYTFYHGTSLEATEAIAREGFQIWVEDNEIGRYARGGNLGTGIYLSCNWRMSLWFGSTLLRVGVRPGTKLLNTAIPPDDKTIDYLQREFGRDILRKPAWKILPKNKKLKLGELVNLFRYHYGEYWEKNNPLSRKRTKKAYRIIACSKITGRC